MHKAELYSSSHGLQKRDAAHALTEYLDHMTWRPGDRVLDVGCGPGFVTAQELMPRLPQDFAILVGTDVSHAMVQHATSTYVQPKLKFAHLDISSTHIDKELWEPGFDKIFSFYCLHWIPDQRTAVNNIYHLLRPAGEALVLLMAKCPVFNVYTAQSNKPKWQQYMKDASRYISPYHQLKDPKSEFINIVEDVGFHVVDCDCRQNKFNYGTLERLKDAIKAVNPFMDRIPEELQEEYLNDCLSEARRIKCTESNNNVEEVTTVSYDIIVAHIKKP
nr:juvenile hormone acid methyltransferase [Diploptera punctata]